MAKSVICGITCEICIRKRRISSPAIAAPPQKKKAKLKITLPARTLGNGQLSDCDSVHDPLPPST